MNVRKIGPYRIEYRIGSGGMGAVYKAWDERLGRPVAIKSVLPSKELSSERRERFRREARSAARLNHPSIAQVHDIVLQDGRDHIVMEFVEGKSLSALLAEKSSIEPKRAVSIARQVAAGLEAAHEHGIIHRDLKAANVMVDRKDRVKILDFGLAKMIEPDNNDESLTEEGMVIGTCRAMSPEQAEGQRVDHRSDLFSLGSLLYTMVTGKHPFATASPMATMRRVVFEDPEPASSVSREVPSDLSALIHRLLAKDPAQRPADAREVCEALDTISVIWTAPTTHHSTFGGPVSRSLEAPVRSRAPWLLAGAALVLVLVAAGLGWRIFAPMTPTKVVAVLAPEVGADTDPQATTLPADAVRMALLNSVAGLEGLVVPDMREVDGVSGNPDEVAVAVAADEVIATEISGCDPMCRLHLRRLDSAGAMLPNGGRSFEVLADDLLLLANAVTANLKAVYPERGLRSGFRAPEVSAEDYAAYIQVRQYLTEQPAGITREMLLQDLETIRISSPRFLEVHLTEANIARYIFQVHADQAFLQRALGAVERATRLAPEHPSVYRIAFSVHRAGGDLDAAEGCVRRLEEIVPGDLQNLDLRARLCQARGDFDCAVELLTRVANARPSWKNLYTLADAQLHSSRFAEARKNLHLALEKAPRNRPVTAKLAEVELLNGDPEVAERLYEELSERFPSSIYLANLGLARMLMGHFDQAAAAYRQANELSPEEPETMLGLADALLLSGEKGPAHLWYRRCLEALNQGPDQTSADVLCVKAQCLVHLGHHAEAINAVQETLRLAPEDAEVHFIAALVNTVVGQRVSALNHVDRTLALGMEPRWLELPWFDELR